MSSTCVIYLRCSDVLKVWQNTEQALAIALLCIKGGEHCEVGRSRGKKEEHEMLIWLNEKFLAVTLDYLANVFCII